MSELEAVFVANLAPLRCVRRDIALLGFTHRTVLGRGPTHFKQFVKLLADGHGESKHRSQLQEYRDGDTTDYGFSGSCPAEFIQHSVFGLMAIYNRLPAAIVEGCNCVPSFQAALQKTVKARALQQGCSD